jgi:hypothetical protein
VTAGAVVRLGKANYYTTLQKAIEAANAGNGRTITLFFDAAVNAQTVFNKALTFDLNGKTLTLPDPASWTVAHTVTNGNVVVNDTTYTLAKGTYAVISSDDITFTAGAKLGTCYYATLQDAIDAANAGEGGTITMLANYDYGTTGLVSFTKNITIDGQGKYKITASITTDFYQVASNVTLTLQNLTMTATKTAGDNIAVIYLPKAPGAVVNINNCTIKSTNDIALASYKRGGGGYNISNSTIIGHTYAIRYNDSDHAINISDNSKIHGGTYAILMTGDNPCANITITDSTVTAGIYLNSGKAKVTLAGNTVVDSKLIATLYPDAGYTGSDYAVQISTANNALTVKGNAKINGVVNHIAGTINFNESTQIIRKSSNNYYFFDTADAAFEGLQDGDIVFTYSQTVADAAKTQGYTVSEENGYYKIVASNS